MIKIAICDDDLSILKQLSDFIDKYRIDKKQEMECVPFHSPLDLLSEIEKGMCFDALFLDILMPGENGIDVAKEIREYDTNVRIIFLTSSPEFAIESYDVDAYFYKLKPILEEPFVRLMDAVVAECQKNEKKYIVLKCKNGITRIDLDKLRYCEVMGHTLLLHMEDGKVYERVGSLDELSEQLNTYDCFIRPHRSFLINMDFVQNISCKSILMNDDTQIPIPHGKYSEVKEKFLEYMFI